MADHPYRLFAGFNGRQVEIDCGSDRLAFQVRLRLNHLLAAADPGASAALRLTLSEPAASYVELRDSTGRYVAGSLEHVLYFVRKWTTADFAAAHPHLLWLHAGAAAKDGAVVLLAGPTGAGKSTLVVRLLERGWRLFGDDVVPVDVNRQAPCLSRSHRIFGRHHRQISTTSERSSNSRSNSWRYRHIAWHGTQAQSARLSFRRTIAIETPTGARADFCRIGRRDAGQCVLLSNLGTHVLSLPACSG